MIDVGRFTLSNGLRVVHNRNTVARMAAVNVLYKVGSRNESFDYTGIAHLLEHLMFSGTECVPDFDRCMQEAGGENNAWTSNDITNYYDVLPVDNIETAFWLESDRMRNLAFTDSGFNVQRSVVAEEFKQRCLNVPYGDLSHLWRELVYKRHPYRWPVIGRNVEDIETVDKSVVRDFYEKHYSPDNAILSVVGNIDSQEVFELAEKWFGSIPKYRGVRDLIPSEPCQSEFRKCVVKRDVPHRLLFRAYRMCGRLSDDYYACDLLSDLLSNGRSSRFFRNILVKGDLVSSIDASITGDFDDGAFLIKAMLLPGSSYDAVEHAIDAELAKLVTGDVRKSEIEKSANKFESNLLFSNLNNDERASNLAYYEMLGNADMINQEPEKYRSAGSVDNLEKVAEKLFSPTNCSSVYYDKKQ